MAFNPAQLFGTDDRNGSDERLLVAMILQLLAGRLSEPKEDEMLDEREEDAREIHVRPRVEPLGGA